MKLKRKRRLQEEDKLGGPAFTVANECLEASRHPVSISPKTGRESKGKGPVAAYREVAEGVPGEGLCFRTQGRGSLSLNES